MSTDSLGRTNADRGAEIYGACRCCGRWFVDEVTDQVTEARHDSDGYCSGCSPTRRAKVGLPQCKHDFPGSSYRCGFTVEENRAHLINFFDTIAGTSHRRNPA